MGMIRSGGSDLQLKGEEGKWVSDGVITKRLTPGSVLVLRGGGLWSLMFICGISLSFISRQPRSLTGISYVLGKRKKQRRLCRLYLKFLDLMSGYPTAAWCNYCGRRYPIPKKDMNTLLLEREQHAAAALGAVIYFICLDFNLL